MAGDNNTAKDAMSTHEPGAPEGLYSVVARAGRPTLHQVGRPRARPDHIRGLQRGSNRTSGKPEAQQLQSHGLSKWLKVTPSQSLRTSTNQTSDEVRQPKFSKHAQQTLDTLMVPSKDAVRAGTAGMNVQLTDLVSNVQSDRDPIVFGTFEPCNKR